MKKVLSIFACILTLSFAVTSCDWFELDNQDGWNASVEGVILDSETNQPIQFEQGSTITVVEQGWEAQANQTWAVKNDGSYKNTLVFAGSYVMNTLTNNFVAEAQSFELKKGDNTVNFKATPYVRILNPQVTMEGDKIKVTCTVKAGVSSVNNIGEVRICVSPDRFVRQSTNNVSNDPASHISDVKVDGSQQLTLYVDTKLAANAYEFQYDRPHYIRIAAVGAHYAIVPEWSEESQEFDMEAYLAAGMPEDWWNYFKTVVIIHPASYTNDGSVNPSNAYNYSPVYKLENGSITEVTDW